MKNIHTLLFLVSSFFQCFIGRTQLNYIGFSNGGAFTSILTKNFWTDNTFNYGYMGGLQIEREGKKHLMVQSGFYYEQKGFKTSFYAINISGNLKNPDKKSSFNYDYISIPLTIGYRYGGDFFGEIFGGFSFSGLINAKEKYVLGNNIVIENHTNDVTRFDFAPKIAIGQGYRFKNDLIVVFRVEFQHGLINIANSNYYLSSEIRQKGFYLQLSVQKLIKNKKKELPADAN